MSIENSRRMQTILRNARTILGSSRSKDDVIKFLGERPSHISSILGGSISLRDEEIERWAQTLGCSTKTLLEETGE